MAFARGAPATGRSFRFRRRRGAYCGAGYCGLCEVETATGRALACRVAADAPTRLRPDPLRPLGMIAERFPPWFYERPVFRHAKALHLLRRLPASYPLGPAAAPSTVKAWREERQETAIVGEGGNVDGLVIGVYDGHVVGVVREDALVALRVDRLVVATSSYDLPPPITGNDLPGVVGLRAFEAYAAQGAFRSGTRVAVWGPPSRIERAVRVADAHAATVVWAQASLPARIEGRRRVRAVDGVGCDVFVSAVAQPALELAAQAGARLALSQRDLPILVGVAVPEWVELRGEAAARSADVPPVAVPDEAFVCLCEDVRAGDVRRAIASGFDHPELVKRRTGAMTGPCQGRLCAATVLSLLQEAGRGHAPTTARPPAAAVTLAELAADA